MNREKIAQINNLAAHSHYRKWHVRRICSSEHQY
jgi:hypothetical protein